MGNVRVYELAKDMGLENKELLAKLADAGIDVKSHASSLSDEDLQKFKSFNTPTEEKIEEARIKPGLIRRRKTVVRKPVEEPPAAPVAEAPVEPAVAEQPEREGAEPEPVEVKEPVAAEPAAKQSEGTELPEPGDVVSTQPEVPPAESVVEPVVEASPEPVAKKEKTAPKTVEKTSANRATILGRVELPKPSQETDPRRRNGRTERPVRPARPARPERPERPAQARPGAAPVSPRKRPESDLSMIPVEPVPDRDPGRNKKKKKGRHSHDDGERDGMVSRRGRRVEVFEPGRGPRKKKGGKQSKQSQKTEITISKAIKRVIRISDSITVGELAKRMGVKANELIAELMRQGSMVTINHPLDYETAALLASEFKYEVENVAFDEETILEHVAESEKTDSEEDLQIRPPVVTIMGHVDHGKTSLLDAIREANVTEGEAGGITQHIGAYDVELEGKKITFLDTPGHEAFTAMRARGAGVTDIVILVVAADDGVMPQTKEAINHSKAAGVPIIVAINKMDKPEANPDRVKQELTEFELVPEAWGGDTIFVEVSAKTHSNLDTLLEMILLQAEVLELKANPNKRAKGSVVEARLDKGRGPVMTVLVQDGTLKIGDAIVAGLHYGRVRSMISAAGAAVTEAGPSFPVEVTGLAGVPDAGDLFHAVENEKAAKDVAQHRQQKQREIDLAKTSKVSLDQLFAKMQEGVVEELPVIVKADVQGSVEAVREALEKLSTDACRLTVIHTAVGGISESDVTLATASNAIVLGFNVRPENKAKLLAEAEGVDIRLYSVIYDAVNDIRDAMEGLLAPTLREKELGRVEVRETFHVSKVGTIAGCYVVDGKIQRNAQARLVRDSVVVWEGKMDSLKRFKDDVKEVGVGYECGIGLEKYNDIKVGDVIEVFEMEEVKTSL
ncbi:MAG: translation initiation factor IF-2 [Desulfuromonadales bacterium]|nr:translation initiation factor IF-2 [Desulfuromonadales bacterium]